MAKKQPNSTEKQSNSTEKQSKPDSSKKDLKPDQVSNARQGAYDVLKKADRTLSDSVRMWQAIYLFLKQGTVRLKQSRNTAAAFMGHIGELIDDLGDEEFEHLFPDTKKLMKETHKYVQEVTKPKKKFFR